MTRTERLLRLARLRGDRLAIATLGGAERDAIHARSLRAIDRHIGYGPNVLAPESESELRAAWGDR